MNDKEESIMVESADEVLLTEATPPSHIVETETPCSSHPEAPLVFHCRPDLSGRSLLFQDRNARAAGARSGQRQIAPVQLLTMDGRSKLGWSVAGHPSIPSPESPFYPGQDEDKLARVKQRFGHHRPCTQVNIALTRNNWMSVAFGDDKPANRPV
ncbi:hypothetical protein PHYPSEUDO_001105 [Phytophthora pseudosyringae]|uniref:Uncharacterized protein n=1 Tax=Phytophthora pseudosyringae TaxID=221518 RepID=A0A8T1VWB3_9STRA|nr:hypothetical protein PHYPSEUDO_001105 [Phytophthora pseudosyringae]